MEEIYGPNVNCPSIEDLYGYNNPLIENKDENIQVYLNQLLDD